MASWKSETGQPRASAGETSEMYTGTVLEDSPIPRPTMIRPAISMPGARGGAEQRSHGENDRRHDQQHAPAEKVCEAAAAQRADGGARQHAADDHFQGKDESEKSFFRNSSAPEMTPVSYPKSKPPRPANVAAR